MQVAIGCGGDTNSEVGNETAPDPDEAERIASSLLDSEVPPPNRKA